LIDIALFWCCLNPRERLVIAGCLAAWVGLLGYITKVDYDGLWTAQGISPTNALAVSFVFIYRLTAGVVEVDEGVFIDVYFFDGVFWPLMAAYAIDPGLSCSSPCSILTFPS